MNWQEFFAMNGYATYVWGSFGMCFALMAAEVFALRRRMRITRGLIARRSVAAPASFGAQPQRSSP